MTAMSISSYRQQHRQHGTAPVSIASSSSAGAAGGSVINVSSLVSQLVAATQAPQEALINTQTQAVTTQISALGTLKSALSTFQSSLSALDTPTAFDTETANSSNHDGIHRHRQLRRARRHLQRDGVRSWPRRSSCCRGRSPATAPPPSAPAPCS